MQDRRPVVQLDALSKRFGGHAALTDVSLQLQPGELFGYLGPNGAGKTTTLRILMGLLRPTSGTARAFGLDTWRDASEVHRQVGYVAGDVSLYGRLTGEETLGYLGSLRGGYDEQYVAVLAKQLDAQMDRPVRTLSKGNRQKIAILQALMCRPRLLVLDEPTTGLDPLVQQQVHDLLRDHVAAGGTVLLSSHVLSEVQAVADRVGILRAGRLIAVERLDDLRQKSLHRVRVTFAEPVDPSPFTFPGVTEVTVGRCTLSCSATQHSLDRLLRAISASGRVVDLACEEASLDDTFLSYYSDPESGP